ncbi:hypothetical protein MH117_09830 [Paenibacillus sp. ACRRX]|uniref:hypothetical protein n=1 Tax=Paenibacillus sp. ACRRX TaxID=2918206 RepID=UPI001EF5ED4F|nr:hypothetical protein [Paenibacillus sp. ACRRX]MCG7407722.1 hypothetical protein [Paenibacillus sp. ACRRX]
MASIIMYEILTTIRKHPFLLTVAEITWLSEEEARKVDGMIAEGFRQAAIKRKEDARGYS